MSEKKSGAMGDSEETPEMRPAEATSEGLTNSRYPVLCEHEAPGTGPTAKESQRETGRVRDGKDEPGGAEAVGGGRPTGGSAARDVAAANVAVREANGRRAQMSQRQHYYIEIGSTMTVCELFEFMRSGAWRQEALEVTIRAPERLSDGVLELLADALIERYMANTEGGHA
jgi:hypothetical protein